MTTCHEIPKGCEECDGEGCDKCDDLDCPESAYELCERDDMDGDECESDDMDDSMDGDAGSALASAGFGTDEDYGGFSDFDD